MSDTSVLIDLERGNLLEVAFKLSVDLAVPDILYRRELQDYGGPRLLELGLRIEELEPESIERAQHYRLRQPGITVPDSFALALAQAREWILLTGDGPLRSLADKEKVECHGVLWLLDLMNDEAIVGARLLHDGLQQIAGHPRCRLPKREIHVRLNRLAKLANKR